MNANAPNNSEPSKSAFNLTGHLTAVVILICVVIALVVAVVVEPEFNAQDQAAQTTPLLTPNSMDTPLPPEVEAATPPAVNIDKVIIMVGILVLIVLLAVLREILWYKQHS